MSSLETLKKLAHAKMADAKINWETFEDRPYVEDQMVEQMATAVSKIKPLEALYEELTTETVFDVSNKSKAELDAEYRYIAVIEQDLMTGYQFEWLTTVYKAISEVTK